MLKGTKNQLNCLRVCFESLHFAESKWASNRYNAAAGCCTVYHIAISINALRIREIATAILPLQSIRHKNIPTHSHAHSMISNCSCCAPRSLPGLPCTPIKVESKHLIYNIFVSRYILDALQGSQRQQRQLGESNWICGEHKAHKWKWTWPFSTFINALFLAPTTDFGRLIKSTVCTKVLPLYSANANANK